MHTSIARLALAGLALSGPALAPSAAAADSIRCDGGIVQVGDGKLDLLARCGRPSLTEVVRSDRTTVRRGADGQVVGNAERTAERWTYDFGPQQFVQVVTLEGGLVRSVARGSYGHEATRAGPPPAIARATCDPSALHEGDTTYEVQGRCGPPASVDLKQGPRPLPYGTTDWYAANQALVDIEVWTYDFGPSQHQRRVEFVDGRVTRIETGNYGYSR